MTSPAREPSRTIRSSACRTSSRSGCWRAEPAQAGMGVRDHRRDRLIDLMGDRGRQLPHGRDAIGVRERLPFFFRPPTFGYIHHGSHEFDEIADVVEHRMTDNVDVLELSIGHQQSMFKIEILPVLRCTIDCLLNTGSVAADECVASTNSTVG